MNYLKYIFTSLGIFFAMFLSSTQAEILVGLGAPLTGPYAWSGEQYRIGAQVALDKINKAGGVLGEQVRLIPSDDAADPEQAKAVAKKFVNEGVALVVGHWASGASIAAAPIYAKANILMISPSSTNPKVTDDAGNNVFRVCGRDDRQGQVIGDYLADNWKGKKIAIIHDGTTYGHGLSELTKQHINKRGVSEVVYEKYTPDKTDYSPLITKLKTDNIDVVFVGGYAAEASLMVREARDQKYDLQFVSGDAIASSDFWMTTGDAGEGTVFTFFPDPRGYPSNKQLVEEFRALGVEPDDYTLYAYAVVEVWAQAVAYAKSLELDKVADALQKHEFKTVLGSLSFDDNGDIKTSGFSWYVWSGGKYKSLQ